MFDITIQNFLGISDASIRIDKGVTLLAGRNSAGKTSVIRGLAALLGPAGTPLGLKKAEAFMLLRAGATQSTLELNAGGNDVTSLHFPSCEKGSSGHPPQIDPIAAGTDHPLDMTDRQRASYFSERLVTAPTRADLEAALTDVTVPAASLDKIWNTIETEGWDNAHAKARDTGTKLKGQWELVTGENFGVKKAANWQPKSWLPEWDGLTPERADILYQEAQAAEASVIASHAVSQAQIDQYRAEAARVPELEQERDRLATEVKAAEIEHQDLKAKSDGLPSGTAPHVSLCPHCEKPIAFEKIDAARTRILKGELVSEQELQQRRKAIQDSLGPMFEAERRLNSLREQQAANAAALYRAQDAARHIEATPQASADGDPLAAKTATAEALARRDAVQAAAEAARIVGTIKLNQAIVAALAPEGVRQTVLQRAAKPFNQALAEIAKVAGWQRAQLEGDLSISQEGRPYSLLAANEQFRIRLMVQIALAEQSGAALILVDGADILEKSARNQMFGLLIQRQTRAVVGMTLSDRSDAPDLAARQLGRTYWIEAGQVHQIGAAAQAAE